MLEAAEHPLIELITNADLLDVSGHIGNFEVTIRQNPRFVNDRCNGCRACTQICPIYAPNKFEVGMGARKAVYIPFDQAVPNKALIDRKKCIECHLCLGVCELKAIDFDQTPIIKTVNVGTIIVASGFQLYNPESEFGYGIFANVITQVELERLLAPNGPNYGEVVRPSDQKAPKKIAMIQCVGSRNMQSNLHCSGGVCCMVAIKNATLLKQHIDGAEVTICYMDIRAAGKNYEEYFLQSRRAGVKYLRGTVANIKEDPETKDLILRVEDTLTQEIIDLRVDMVVLSTAMEPSRSTEEISRILRLDKSPDGFLKEYHDRLDPIDTKIPGIYLAGAVQGPKSIAETVATGKAAASSAAIPMVKKVHEIIKLECIIDPDRCSGCRLCEDICPYQAISMLGDIAKVDTILCRGCGQCAAVCLSHAATLRAYRDNMLESYLDALFSES
ncbi:MAG: 4Fe-4S binding protein [Candidatus Helarchaeota archaeon]